MNNTTTAPIELKDQREFSETTDTHQQKTQELIETHQQEIQKLNDKHQREIQKLNENHQQEIQDIAEIKDDKNGDPSESNFQCSICLETAKNAVITLCGHLFWLACEICYENLILYKLSNLL